MCQKNVDSNGANDRHKVSRASEQANIRKCLCMIVTLHQLTFRSHSLSRVQQSRSTLRDFISILHRPLCLSITRTKKPREWDSSVCGRASYVLEPRASSFERVRTSERASERGCNRDGLSGFRGSLSFAQRAKRASSSRALGV